MKTLKHKNHDNGNWCSQMQYTNNGDDLFFYQTTLEYKRGVEIKNEDDNHNNDKITFTDKMVKITYSLS